MQYRKFLTLTDEEIMFILQDIFHPKKLENIVRNKKDQSIDIDMTTVWHTKDEKTGYEKELEVKDTVTLTQERIYVDFQMASGDHTKYLQYLMSKGCNWLLKDNPYMNNNGTDTKGE